MQGWLARKVIRRRKTRKYDEDSVEVLNLGVVRRIEHENLIKLFQMYQCDAELNFVFPFIELDLHKVLFEGKTPPGVPNDASTATSFIGHWLWMQMSGVAAALDKLHYSKLEDREVAGFHFDLKPDNILVTDAGILKITDFGISLFMETGGGYSTGVSKAEAGEIAYRPPESMLGYKAHRDYDIWSLACIMMEVFLYTDAITKYGDTNAGKTAVVNFGEERRKEGSYGNELQFFVRDRNSGKSVRKESVDNEMSRLKHEHGQTKLNDFFEQMMNPANPESEQRPRANAVSETLQEINAEYSQRQIEGEVPLERLIAHVNEKVLNHFDIEDSFIQ
jgi:serine/threonine protein kinase